jgi:hypothetical protein
MMFSAAFTIGTTLTVATYYVMRDKRVLARLQAEIAEVWPSTRQNCPSWSALEKLPYLVSADFRGHGSMQVFPKLTPNTECCDKRNISHDWRCFIRVTSTYSFVYKLYAEY